MVKKSKRNLKIKKIITYLVIPVFLFVVGVVLSLFFGTISFSTLSFVHSKDVIRVNPGRIMYKADKIIGQFKAVEPHLGIIQVRLDRSNSVSFKGEDALDFKIKGHDSNSWLSEKLYYINDFDKSFILPLGFPVQDDSQGKTYDFEIESIYGNGANSVKLSSREPVVQSVYKYQKTDILSSPISLVKFIVTKILFSINNVDFLFAAVLYFIPLLFYLLLIFVGVKLNFIKKLIFCFVLILICFDSFVVLQYSTGVIIGILGLWVICLFIYELESTASYLASALLVSLLLLLILFKIQNGQDKLAIYIYTFLIIGILQSLYELKFKPKHIVDPGQSINEVVKSHGK